MASRRGLNESSDDNGLQGQPYPKPAVDSNGKFSDLANRRSAPASFADAFRRVAIPRLKPEVIVAAIDLAVGRATWREAHAEIIAAAGEFQVHRLEPDAFLAFDDWAAAQLMAEWANVEPLAARMAALSWVDLMKECAHG